MTPPGGKRVQGSVTVIRRGAGLDQLTLTARYYEERHVAGCSRAAAAWTTRCAL
jgi:hypothetical protein